MLKPKVKVKKEATEPVGKPLDVAITEAEEEEKAQSLTLNVSKIQERVKRLLDLSTFEPEVHYYLDTGFPELNAALGSCEMGLPYGKMFELSGIQHSGKTTVGNIVAGMAQKDGAAVGYLDLENSRDPLWAAKLGLNFDNVFQIYPKLVYKGKDLILQSIEDLFEEAEATMQILCRKGCKKQFWLVDSVAMMVTGAVIEAGAKGQNMHTKSDRAAFLALHLPRWCGYAANYNAMIFLVNQLRVKPGISYGDPRYTPGGNALEHTCSIRARVRRFKNGFVRDHGKVIGIVGIIKNTKNKSGGGSVEQESCGFKVVWNKTPAKIRFMTAKEAEEELE